MIVNYLWIGCIVTCMGILMRIIVIKEEKVLELGDDIFSTIGAIIGIFVITPIWPISTAILINDLQNFIKQREA